MTIAGDDDREDGNDNGNDNYGDSERAVPSKSRTTYEGGDSDDEEIKVFTDNPANHPLYRTSYQLHEQSLLDREILNVDGEVKNDNTDAASFVKITATFYDVNNRTLRSDIAFSDLTNLEPGQSAPFKMAAGALGNLDVDDIRYVNFHLSSQ